MEHPLILTIGHSSHHIDRFANVLERHEVTLLVDVRSVPFSQAAPQFNRHALSKRLANQRVGYVFLGDELGGRSRFANDYDAAGRVQYERMAATEAFQHGVATVLERAAGSRVALMCAEKDPLECHRTLLVSIELEKNGARVAHILEDGRLETHDAAMSRLLTLHGMQDQALFDARDQLIHEAARLQARRVAFVDRRMQSPPRAPIA